MSQRQVVELGRGSAEMEPIRTDNKSDEVDGGEGTTAAGNGRLGFRAQRWEEPLKGHVLGRGWAALGCMHAGTKRRVQLLARTAGLGHRSGWNPTEQIGGLFS